MDNYFETDAGAIIPFSHIDYVRGSSQDLKIIGKTIILKSGKEVWIPEKDKDAFQNSYKRWLQCISSN